MNKKSYTRPLIGLLALGCLISIVYGLIIKEMDPVLGNSYIGFGTLFLFLVAMPLFIFSESRGKKLDDYMLNEKNIRRMRAKTEKDSKKNNKSAKNT